MALGCAGAALVAAGCGLTSSSTKTTTVTTTVTRTVTHTVTTAAAAGNFCTASDLTGTFQVLQGSAGAGNIVYTLKVTNAAQGPCNVRGIPGLDVLDANGAEMDTRVSASPAHEPLVTLQPGASATSQIRFSPDVDPCDPGTATTLRVTLPNEGSLDVKFDPATKFCGAGSLQPTPFSGAD